MNFGPGSLVIAIVGGWWLVTALLFVTGAPAAIVGAMVGSGVGHLIGMALITGFYVWTDWTHR